jgi:hypothetical protein
VVQRGILRQFGGAKIPDAERTVPVETNKLPALDKIKPREALQSILKGLMK